MFLIKKQWCNVIKVKKSKELWGSTRITAELSPDRDSYRGEANIKESQSLLHPMVITSGSLVLEVMTDLIRTKVKFKP